MAAAATSQPPLPGTLPRPAQGSAVVPPLLQLPHVGSNLSLAPTPHGAVNPPASLAGGLENSPPEDTSPLPPAARGKKPEIGFGPVSSVIPRPSMDTARVGIEYGMVAPFARPATAGQWFESSKFHSLNMTSFFIFHFCYWLKTISTGKHPKPKPLNPEPVNSGPQIAGIS